LKAFIRQQVKGDEEKLSTSSSNVLYPGTKLEKVEESYVKTCVCDTFKQVKKLKPSECEVLYGRVGYLYSLLFLRRCLKDDNKLAAKQVKDLVKDIVEEGVKSAKRNKRYAGNLELFYSWHEKCYIGAAHGLCGIFNILLYVSDEIEELGYLDILRRSIDALLEMKFDSKNMPSSLGSSRDKLVHWCHGATGFVSLCLNAQKVFKDEKYLQHAREFGNVIWLRGMLSTKGLGLCHGMPGNGMVLLSLYRKTKNELWLRRAQHFASMTVEKFNKLSLNSDNPCSLFTGVLGGVVFLGSVLNPDKSWFLGYEI